MNSRYSGRRNGNIQEKQRKRSQGPAAKSRRMHPVAVFFITLGAVVFTGMAVIVCICLPRYLKLHADEKITFVSFVEAIPETITSTTSSDPEEEIEEPASRYGHEIGDPEYLRQNNILLREGNEEGVVSLNFSGDILFDDEYCCMASLILRGGDLSTCFLGSTLDRMRSADITVVNNEFPYTDRGSRTPDKTYCFRAEPDTASYLNDMGADVAILANNHSYDYGKQGLVDSLEVLKCHGISPLGAGMNIEEASAPVYFIVNDIKVAIIATTQIERLDYPDTKGATDVAPGVFRCWNSSLIYDVVAKAKDEADFVIVCVHWGTEKEEEPDTWQTQMAPKLAEAGADLIVGDHTHRLQGVYYYGDTPCIYSLGNFWFNGSTIDTGMLEVRIDASGLKSLEFIPAIQSNYSVQVVEGAEKTRILSYLRSLSRGAVIDEEGYIYPDN